MTSTERTIVPTCRRINGRWLTFAVALWVAACAAQDQPVVPAPPAAQPSRAAPFVVAPAASVVTAEQDVYVSLPPDSIPSGVNATITNRRTGASVTTAIVAGGFDPVAIPAVAGDSLTIAVQTAASPLSFTVVVPPVVPPVVVRTDPPAGKRDVPLNASLVMVFSQPIDATTLTGNNVQLLNGTNVVPGTVSFGDAQHVMATFQPAAPLAANTAYRIAVSTGVRDTHGDPLVAPLSVAFTTGQQVSTNTLVASVTASPVAVTIAFDAAVVLSATAKDSAGNVLTGQTFSWSSLVPGVATVSTSGVVTAVSAGTAALVVTCEGKAAQVIITVYGSGPPAASVTVSPSARSLGVGEVAGLIATIRDAAGNPLTGRTVTWTTDAPAIATVSGSGYLSGVAVGAATVTATSGGVTGSVPITVTPAVPSMLTGEIAYADCREPQGDYCGIVLANANGSGDRYLTQSPNHAYADVDPNWSPDGTHLAMQSGRYCGTSPSASCYYQIYVMNADGTGITQLTNAANFEGYGPVWSPDGRRIAFSGYTLSAAGDLQLGNGLYVMTADGSNITALAGAAGLNASGQSWSPDGTRIAFAGSRDEISWHIYIMNADGTGATQISPDSTSDNSPAWSPDGSQIAFTRIWQQGTTPSGEQCQVFVMGADGSHAVRLTNDSFCASLPSWSPDGLHISFSGYGGLSIMNVDGTGVRLVSPGSFSGLTWSPPGVAGSIRSSIRRRQP